MIPHTYRPNASDVPERTETDVFAEPLHKRTDSALLASLLGYRRGGGPAPEIDLSPDQWVVWSAGLVADQLRSEPKVPFPACPKDRALAGTSPAWRVQWVANRAHVLGCRWKRRALTAALGSMVVGWAVEDDARWGALAEQWRDRFLALPGPPLEGTPRYESLCRDVMNLLLARRRSLGRAALSGDDITDD